MSIAPHLEANEATARRSNGTARTIDTRRLTVQPSISRNELGAVSPRVGEILTELSDLAAGLGLLIAIGAPLALPALVLVIVPAAAVTFVLAAVGLVLALVLRLTIAVVGAVHRNIAGSPRRDTRL